MKSFRLNQRRRNGTKVCVFDDNTFRDATLAHSSNLDAGGGEQKRPTCPRSRVTLTSLYSVLRDRGGLCHHRSVPSMALVMGWARSLSLLLQTSQY